MTLLNREKLQRTPANTDKQRRPGPFSPSISTAIPTIFGDYKRISTNTLTWGTCCSCVFTIHELAGGV